MSLSDGTEEDVGGEDGLSTITYESEVEKKSRKKKSNKPPMSPKSPYLSNTYLHPKKAAVWRSLKGTGTIHIENPSIKVPREMWVASLRHGFAVSQSLKSECDSGCSRSSGYTSTPEYLKEALGMKKPKHSRSASNGYVPGTPDYKEKEDMYDEIIELKKIIQAHKADNDILKTKLRRSEEENSRKKKQIEQLLDPSKSSEYARSLVDKKNDTSGIVNGLKQRLFKLEQQCKEKDGIINKFQNDLKTTNIEEMKIAMETYYEEIQRLRLLLTDNDTVEKKSIMESRELQKEIKVLNSTILRLSKSLKQLQEENKTLKANLEQESFSSSTSSTARGYNEWTKSRLVRRVLELEKKISNPEPLNSKASSRDLEEKLPHAECIRDQIQQQEQQQVSHQQECNRLRELIKKLKEDRSNLQTQLAKKDAEVKQQLQEKAKLGKDLQRLKEMDKPAEEYKHEVSTVKERIRKLEAELEDHRRMKKRLEAELEDHQRMKARNELAEKEDIEMEEAINMIQACARGHLARQTFEGLHSVNLKQMPGASPWQYESPRVSHNTIQKQILTWDERDEAISLIQSSFRAHLTRTQYLKGRKNMSAGDSRDTSVNVRKSSDSQLQARYSGFWRDNESSDEIEEDIFRHEDPEDAEYLKKLKISPNRPSSMRSSQSLSQISGAVESDDSDDVILF
ncbi:IQ domain-containing protein E [Pristis pectinata]|uniref:IQ domain-containing protein E n=1 Tax=Pristis pectinata TaxID=685728 RepID=UPI00223C9FF3|nr:IQ domain-containing protein E [Pristis pectinata]